MTTTRKTNNTRRNSIIVAVLIALSALLSACDNPIRDTILVPNNGGSCAGADFGMPCTG